MEYESQLGVFSPDGRLIQVEYAQNASAQGATIVVQATDKSIRIFYENRLANNLAESCSRLHLIDADRKIYLAFSGLKPDSLKVINEAIYILRNYKFSTSEDISLLGLAKKIGKFKQQFTVSSSMRPLGLRTILFAIENGKPVIFIIETDGNFSEYSRYALGFKSEVALKYLEEHGEDDCGLRALLKIVQKDSKKIKGFELSEEGLVEIEESVISSVQDQ